MQVKYEVSTEVVVIGGKEEGAHNTVVIHFLRYCRKNQVRKRKA